MSSSAPTHRLASKIQQYFEESKSGAASPTKLRMPDDMSRYSAQPDLSSHSSEVISIFVALFRKHIPQTLSMFNDLLDCQAKQPSVHYVFAIAALGGLFSNVQGSAQVAKFIYNDARRICLAAFNTRDNKANETSEDKLEMIKTLIALELYGLCSGDKRSYELAEAFQGNLTSAVEEYSMACLQTPFSSEADKQTARLLEALYIIDCYRVIIMNRSPALVWRSVARIGLEQQSGGLVAQVASRVADLANGTGECETMDLASLCSLASHLWPVTRARLNAYREDNMRVDSICQTKADFVEEACQRWMLNRSRSTQEGQAELLCTCSHMMVIMLHANLTILQLFAQSAPGSSVRDTEKGGVAKEVYAWVQSYHYEAAAWYAEKLVDTVEIALGRSQAQQLQFEAPHVPYAIYYASLVLWCKSFKAQTSTACSESRAPLVRGERLLSLHRMHVAQLLARILNELPKDTKTTSDASGGHDSYGNKSGRRWRMPLSFGPSPGPRQSLHGRRLVSDLSTFSTKTVRFKTSRSYLEKFLPTPAFSFTTQDPVAQASYVVTTLDKMEWLGGHGYNYWALYLHDVQYTRQDGTVLKGDFLAAMFEDLTDPIITGREELGFPKLYSEISCAKNPTDWKMESSWRGATYLKITLEDLEEVQAPAAEVHDGALAYKYVPATGNPGVADVEYAVCCPVTLGKHVQRYRSTTKARIEVDVGSERTLPTLHHIVRVLADLPVYEIVLGSAVDGVGVDDLSSVYRVE
ncbi:hypothetical protein PRZ48_006201 [Zasmidium cellare]|uniref:Uncharacterized protein n=1 Tax=Zasmidium cellare TaxID=395010 RepID=A0ABR0EMT7_ZASCE|nr:hypothetical protein PRZ48_006201 [Zasmidium cellare]